MTPDGSHASLHDRRITLIVAALRDEPESDGGAVMSEDTAHRLATRVLDALDHLPGSVRRPTGATADGDADLDLLDMETCPACPHPVATHDVIGARFCRVTVTRALSRGCSCPV